MRTLKERIELDGITMETMPTEALVMPPGFADGSNGWDCTVRRQRRAFRVTMWMGPALKGEPSIADVLECVLDDAAGVEQAQSFEEWAREFGFSNDEPDRGREVYDACVRQTAALRVWLRDELPVYLYDTRR